MDDDSGESTAEDKMAGVGRDESELEWLVRGYLEIFSENLRGVNVLTHTVHCIHCSVVCIAGMRPNNTIIAIDLQRISQNNDIVR